MIRAPRQVPVPLVPTKLDKIKNLHSTDTIDTQT